jgi:hypothetical protein
MLLFESKVMQKSKGISLKLNSMLVFHTLYQLNTEFSTNLKINANFLHRFSFSLILLNHILRVIYIFFHYIRKFVKL